MWAHSYFSSGFGACPNSIKNCDNSTQGRGLGAGLPGSLHTGNRINTLCMDGSIQPLDPGR